MSEPITICDGIAFAEVAMAGIGVGFCAIPPSANTLIALLEQRIARAEIGNGNGVVGVIALGGNPERIRKAARLAQLYPHFARHRDRCGRPSRDKIFDRAAH
jgi:hypothetical protein